jgi:hypothetical protein
MDPFKNKYRFGICGQREGEKDRRNLEKDSFGGSRKMRQNMERVEEDDWQQTESAGDDSHMTCVSYGREGYTASITASDMG